MYYVPIRAGEGDERASASVGGEIVSITVNQDVPSASTSLPTLDREYVYTLTTSGEYTIMMTDVHI